ncbi:MAG: cell division protein FtsX [bacterium]
MSKFNYLIGSTWKNLTRNKLMNIVAISSSALALMIIGGVLLIQQNVSHLVQQMKTRASVVVYLKEDVATNQRQNLQSRLISQSDIKDVTYRSPEQAMQQFRSRMGNNSEILMGLNENPLPASFVINLHPDAVKKISSIAEKISGWEGVESVDYGEGLIQRIQQLSRVVQLLLGIVGVIISLVAIFIIFNTIQLAVVSRQDEIDILKLVGATRGFIGLPFVMGGIVQGLSGALFGMGLMYGLFWVVQRQLAVLPFVAGDFQFLSLLRILLVILTGVVLGVIGSVTAVYRSVRHM